MKILIAFIPLFFFLSCNTNKSVTKNTHEASNLKEVTSNCPDDGVCAFEVLKNKSFNIKKDEFGNSYSELLDGNKTVLKFEYTRNTAPDVQDANYSEIIYIEIENTTDALELKNLALSKANVGFTRLCFCRGQTGTYPVNEGQLSIAKENDTYSLNFSFKVNEVPQVIKLIKETFTL